MVVITHTDIDDILQVSERVKKCECAARIADLLFHEENLRRSLALFSGSPIRVQFLHKVLN